MYVQPYLSFEGRAEEAVDYYQRTLGARLDGEIMRFGQSPEQLRNPPNSTNKVMHCAFRIGDSLIMASDGNCSGKAAFGGISLAISVSSDSDAERLFNALADDGQVQMPMSQTFFASRFGVVSDKFGVSWMIVTASA